MMMKKYQKPYFLGASAAMYVFDLSREETYNNLENQIQVIKDLSGLKNITLVGNKKDLLNADELLRVKEIITLPIDLITSAKEDENVEDAFTLLAEQSLN